MKSILLTALTGVMVGLRVRGDFAQLRARARRHPFVWEFGIACPAAARP